MNRFSATLAAAALLFAGAATATPAVAVVQATSSVADAATVLPLFTRCRTGLSPVATATAHGKPGMRVPFVLYVNNRVSRKGTLTANAAGVFASSGEIVNNHSNSVRLQIISHTAVYGVVRPACAAAVALARGSASSYSVNHNSNGSVARWNPCDGAIHVLVNATRGGAGALADTQRALAVLSTATGLRFVYDGPTSFIPTRANSSSQPARLVIAWAPPGTGAGRSDYFGAGEVGEGGWRSSGVSNNGGATWTWKIVQGFVVVDPTVAIAAGFGAGVSRGALLLHELGHVVGLNHTGDGAQEMYPSLRSATLASYGAGDLAGLRAVGASKGCTVAS